MDVCALLTEAYGRLPHLVRAAVDGLEPDQLCTMPAPGTNTVGWLTWHLSRIQDRHVAELIHREQVYVSGGWGPRFGLPTDPADTGYGHTDDQVAKVRPASAQVVIGYYDAVAAVTQELLDRVTDKELDRVVDESWDPPVTLGVRLISVLDDDLQHVGQAAYGRGILLRTC
jgi:Protein of unknown function (DUF664)